MLIRSISSTVAKATDQATARSLIRAASTCLLSGASTLESARPFTRRAGSRITAAAYTGPASGPRPASAAPQISDLSEDTQHRVGGLLGRVLAQQVVKFAEALDLAALAGGVAQQGEQRA